MSEASLQNETDPIIRPRTPHPYHRKSVSTTQVPNVHVNTSSLEVPGRAELSNNNSDSARNREKELAAGDHSAPSSSTSRKEKDRESISQRSQSSLNVVGSHGNGDGTPASGYTPSTTSSISSESGTGTDADDEKDVVRKGLRLSRRRTLPAPPPKRHQTGQWEVDEDEQPRLKRDETEKEDVEGKEVSGGEEGGLLKSSSRGGAVGGLGGRKKIVFVRRGLEVSLMVVLMLMVCNQADVRRELRTWKRELTVYALTFMAVIGSHPAISNLRKPFTVILPSSLDPSPLLYTMVFPAAIALSLTPYTDKFLLSTLVCSLSSIPPNVFPRFIANDPNLKYLFTLMPVLASSRIKHDAVEHLFYTPLLHANLVEIGVELLIPSLTTTETRLLATAFVQLLDSAGAQMITLKTILWMTGGALIIGCRSFMQKEIDLERSIIFARSRPWSRRRKARKDKIPIDAFMGHTSSDSDSTVKHGLSKARAAEIRKKLPKFLPDELPQNIPILKYYYAIPVYLILVITILSFERPYLAAHAFNNIDPFPWAAGYLLSGLPFYDSFLADFNLSNYPGLKIPLPEPGLWGPNYRLFLAGYWLLLVTIGIIIVITLGKGVRVPMEKLGFEIQGPGWLGLAEVARGRAVEVDTRRKVFHGLVVAMFLPTIYLDPPFVATALLVTLAIFLLVDILRATLIPPISKPLSIFLAPYVDGRDLRGPIVVSHIFLLIGCAIPVWLSLSGMELSEKLRLHNSQYALNGDTVQTPFGPDWLPPRRELAMIAGVVCVGMGDAAASLIGRRFGRHKWGWSGGKSIEGSLAFTFAVYLGLLVGKVWLIAGNFKEGYGGITRGGVKALGQAVTVGSVGVFTGKALAVGGLCSLVEAVITGGNDNVVVPIVLWLAIRGLEI